MKLQSTVNIQATIVASQSLKQQIAFLHSSHCETLETIFRGNYPYPSQEGINKTTHSWVDRPHIWECSTKSFLLAYFSVGASLVSQSVKKMPGAGDPSWIPGSGRSPEEGNGKPLQYPCPEKSDGEEPGGSPWGSQRVRHYWATFTFTLFFL